MAYGLLRPPEAVYRREVIPEDFAEQCPATVHLTVSAGYCPLPPLPEWQPVPTRGRELGPLLLTDSLKALSLELQVGTSPSALSSLRSLPELQLWLCCCVQCDKTPSGHLPAQWPHLGPVVVREQRPRPHLSKFQEVPLSPPQLLESREEHCPLVQPYMVRPPGLLLQPPKLLGSRRV